MDIALPVLGGLGLLLYGMNVMGAGLQKSAGTKLKRIIEVLTKNILMGVFVGALVTMIIQSSSATTVMVIGFVNAGIMSLVQATGVIMGANIGTTITAQLIAFNLSDYAPIAIIIGVGLWITTSKKKTKDIAEVLIGFGILFIGMDMMGSGLKPLAELPAFTNIMTSLNNPILGMLAGFALTTIVQSSSASIGLVQALASQGLISINLAFPILFGENIGTTTTALISSVGANKTAKRAAIIHFLFNFTGTIVFMTILRYPIQWLVAYMSPDNVARQIANAHSLFNIINVIIQLPFAKFLVKAAQWLVPGDDRKEDLGSIYLDSRIIETPSIALGQANKEVIRMGDLVLENLELSRQVLVEKNYDKIDEVLERERLINKIEREITEYLVLLSNAVLSDQQHNEINSLLYTINDMERIGDHVENIVELSQYEGEHNVDFTKEAVDSLNEMFNKCIEVVGKTVKAFEFINEDLAKEVLTIEDEIDSLEKKNRKDHIERLNKKECETESGIIFLDTISNLERVSDHSVNIAMYVLDKFK